MKDCERIHNSLSAWFDHEVAVSEAEQIKSHVDLCPACSAVLARLERLDRALRQTWERRSSEIAFEPVWKNVERRIQQGVPWYRWLWERLAFDLVAAHPRWAVSLAAVLLLGIFAVARYVPEWGNRSNFAFVESIDAHGANFAVFGQPETRTTVIWLYEDPDIEYEQVAPANSGF